MLSRESTGSTIPMQTSFMQEENQDTCENLKVVGSNILVWCKPRTDRSKLPVHNL